MDTRNRKSNFTLVTLQRICVLGVISAEKLKNEKFTDVCITTEIGHTPKHPNICTFVMFQFSQLLLHLMC